MNSYLSRKLMKEFQLVLIVLSIISSLYQVSSPSREDMHHWASRAHRP